MLDRVTSLFRRDRRKSKQLNDAATNGHVNGGTKMNGTATATREPAVSSYPNMPSKPETEAQGRYPEPPEEGNEADIAAMYSNFAGLVSKHPYVAHPDQRPHS